MLGGAGDYKSPCPPHPFHLCPILCRYRHRILHPSVSVTTSCVQPVPLGSCRLALFCFSVPVHFGFLLTLRCAPARCPRLSACRKMFALASRRMTVKVQAATGKSAKKGTVVKVGTQRVMMRNSGSGPAPNTPGYRAPPEHRAPGARGSVYSCNIVVIWLCGEQLAVLGQTCPLSSGWAQGSRAQAASRPEPARPAPSAPAPVPWGASLALHVSTAQACGG